MNFTNSENFSGIILVDKPEGPSSFDVVKKIRTCLKVKKAGHFGTLDPASSGLLIVALSKATKFFDIFKKKEKVYYVTVELGIETDTYDKTGKIIKKTEKIDVSRDELESAIKNFIGEIEQIPPPFSAKKFKGKPLYEYAREGRPIIPKPSKVFIHYIKLFKYEPPIFEIEVRCSSGTYMRSLAKDIGELLGVGAVMYSLRRLKIGEYSLEKAISFSKIKECDEKFILKHAIPIEMLLTEYPKVILTPRGSILAENGNSVPVNYVLKIEGGKGEYYRLFDDEGRFLALGKAEINRRAFKPVIVLR